MDVFSRYIISWQLSNTLESGFCCEALKEGLESGCPEYFNTDQGAQLTSQEFTGLLRDYEIKISMDGLGKVYENIFVERLCRTVKYEEVYLHEYRTVTEDRQSLSIYFYFCNTERLYQSSYSTPAEAYFEASTLLEAHV